MSDMACPTGVSVRVLDTQEDWIGGGSKQAKRQLRPCLTFSSFPRLYLTFILGSFFVTRFLGSIRANAPSLVSLGDLIDPHWGSNLPPLGLHGILKPRLVVSLRAEHADEASVVAPLPVASPCGTDLMVSAGSCGAFNGLYPKAA